MNALRQGTAGLASLDYKYDDDQRWCPAEEIGGAPGVDLNGSTLAQLNLTIESDVIPRLILAHRPPSRRATVPIVGDGLPNARKVADFTDVLLAHDSGAAESFVDLIRTHHVSLESIYLDLMTPAARRLGELWGADRCHFTDVTIALGQLQRMLRELSHAFCDEGLAWGFGRRALLVSTPGEQHTFGALMVAEFLRRAGWDVSSEPGAMRNDVLAIVRRERFALVGLSASCERHMEPLASTIRAIRHESLNHSVGILVGGNIFIEHPELVAYVGADATAIDSRDAVDQAENLLALRLARDGA